MYGLRRLRGKWQIPGWLLIVGYILNGTREAIGTWGDVDSLTTRDWGWHTFSDIMLHPAFGLLLLALGIVWILFIGPRLGASYIRGGTIRIAEFVGKGDIIEDKTFEDCEIIGPAILAPIGEFGIIWGNTFEGHPDALFLEAAPGREVIGPIGTKRCTFRKCNFKRIGLLGTPQQIKEWRKGFRVVENSIRQQP